MEVLAARRSPGRLQGGQAEGGPSAWVVCSRLIERDVLEGGVTRSLDLDRLHVEVAHGFPPPGARLPPLMRLDWPGRDL
jgi:hypothetical protein